MQAGLEQEAMPAVTKIWHLLPHDPHKSERLAQTLGTSPVLAQLLLNRGIDQPDHARRFLAPSLTALHPPALLPGVTEAAERILKAVRDGRRICIYGDYDVDGTTGIAVLLLTLCSLGAQNLEDRKSVV